MLFSSSLFVFGFLPLVLGVHFVLPKAARNSWLLLASLAFYSFGEPVFVFAMLGSIAISWALSLLAERERDSGRSLAVPLAAALHLGFLVAFKYADWLVAGVSDALLALDWRSTPLPRIVDLVAPGSFARDALFHPDGTVRLPIGVSFFTFQALSYVIDVRRGDVPAERNPARVALYVALFPQLIAGPIVRYGDVAREIASRDPGLDDFARGIERFVIGLAKKLLVADVLAGPADSIFALAPDQRTATVAWFGLACYTLRIYFDFSGYSDMAIGIGRMLRFRFKENFLHPYASTSITEFWRRWHVSLSSWFRDYLYVPLGGNRKGRARTAVNLVLVFVLCGLWHGAAATFLVWGLWHGAFLVVERLGLARRLERAPRPVGHAYVLLAVMSGWVFFAAPSLDAAVDYFASLVASGANAHLRLEHFLDPWIATCFAAGVVGSTPIVPRLLAKVEDKRRAGRVAPWLAAKCAGVLALFALFVLSALHLATGAFQPFIYFRF